MASARSVEDERAKPALPVGDNELGSAVPPDDVGLFDMSGKMGLDIGASQGRGEEDALVT